MVAQSVQMDLSVLSYTAEVAFLVTCLHSTAQESAWPGPTYLYKQCSTNGWPLAAQCFHRVRRLLMIAPMSIMPHWIMWPGCQQASTDISMLTALWTGAEAVGPHDHSNHGRCMV